MISFFLSYNLSFLLYSLVHMHTHTDIGISIDTKIDNIIYSFVHIGYKDFILKHFFFFHLQPQYMKSPLKNNITRNFITQVMLNINLQNDSRI